MALKCSNRTPQNQKLLILPFAELQSHIRVTVAPNQTENEIRNLQELKHAREGYSLSAAGGGGGDGWCLHLPACWWQRPERWLTAAAPPSSALLT